MLERIILNKYVFVAGIVIVLIGGGYLGYKHQLYKAAEVARKAQEDKQVAAYNVDLTKSLNTTLDLNKKLQEKIEELEYDKANIKRQRDFALDELRKRPTRAQVQERASADPASAPKTCTGAELPREDAEFLTGEAANAALIVKERDFYYERYEQSRLRLEALARELDRRPGSVSNPVPLP